MLNSKKIPPNKILIIARGGIGNILMSTPALRSLKREFSDSDVYVMVFSSGINELLSNNPDIKEIITFDREFKGFRGLFKIVIVLRRLRFDLAIVMHPGGLRSAFWAFISGSKTRIGFDIPLLRGFGSYCYTHLLKPVDKLHDVEQNMKILDLFGIDRDNEGIDMKVTIPEYLKKNMDEYLSFQGIKVRDNIIGFHPGSNPSQKWKRWPAQHFTELINLIYSNWETPVLIFGDQKEIHLINEIISTLNNNVTVVPVIDKNITEVASLISICKAFIGNDSGLMHIAIATDVPTFCIFGPTDVKKTGPYGPNAYIVHSDLDCLFCYNFNTINFKCPENINYKCLNKLYPEEVFKQINPILSHFVD